MRIATLIAAATVLALSTVSTTFVYLTLRSKQWSTQAYFFARNGLSDGTNDTNPLYTAGRSPFYRCGIPIVYANRTCTKPVCAFYRPYGHDATSCRSPAEMGIPLDDYPASNGLLGGSMECQQVHFAGNLQIAACVFITLGLVSSLILVGLAVHHQRRHPRSSNGAACSSFVVLSLLLWLFLLVGALLQVLAQFFGVLGLTVNATPDGASATLYQTQNGENNFVAHDWVVGKGMGAYATSTWTTALAGAFVAGMVFTAPALPKYL